ncbi:aspartate kinase [Pedobacter yulinensis]|uniref:Aspartokinase n=1 Tax=Pedobacter yulinensis TaxID=2126353 RepID=A0A2T3HN22_9SPHI|nr:aspartate kinase [Pedobacter yulinensis]PST83829.1 aspartate kinase [Pedobacter yulinensis]
MEVYKFGGASVKDASGIKNVVSIISSAKKDELLVVVSALHGVTDRLEKLAYAYLSGDSHTNALFEEIKQIHFDVLTELFPDPGHSIFDEISNTFVEIDWLLEEEAQDDPDYLYDQIVSMGEVVSSKILHAVLNASGCVSVWADARNYIKTDNTYREGKVDWALTEREASHLTRLLKNQVAVTQGFIGGTSENYTTTLGREGSDYSAAIFASVLNARSLTIWKDVPGVLNADPKWFEHTEKIPQMSYHDAIELTYYGATVIHPKTIKPLQNKDIPLLVRSFIEPAGAHTEINNQPNPLPVPSFIFKVNQVLISVLPKDYSFIIEENLSTIFGIFHQHKVKVNTMLNSALSFSVSIDHDTRKLDALLESLQKDFRVKYNTNMELVTIRYYNQETIDRVTENKDIILEVKSRHTCQMVMKNKS